MTFKTIERFPGYRFDEDGTVWSERQSPGSWKRLKPLVDKKGYGMVCIRVTPTYRKKFYIHRLIAEAFHGPCPDGLICCHNDGVPSNCRPTNLRWDTLKSNAADARRHGKNLIGERSHNSKFTREQRVEICRKYESGVFNQADLAVAFGVSQATISNILNGRRCPRLDKVQGKAQPEHRDMTAAEYHAHPALGASMLETFRESRRRFYGQHVAKTLPHREPSEAMQLGTLVHVRLLEPERFTESVADPYPETAPDGKNWLRRKGSAHEAWWQEEINKRLGKIAAEQSTLDLVEAVVAAVKANDRANWLLSQQGESEFPIFWTDPETGLPCKIMVDWFAAISLDLKTSCDPSPAAYAKSLVSLGYHRKLAHYKCGLQHYCNDTTEFVHIAAGTSPPHCVACYEVDDRDRQGFNLGAAQRRRTLFELAECYRTNDWREPWEKSVVTLQLPAWAFQEDSYQY